MLNTTSIATNINITQDFDVDVLNSQVVWRALESGLQDYEIFFFDGARTIQVSQNETDGDYAPQVSNGQVVWYSYNGGDAEIYLYNGSQTIQLTDNSANDVSPQILNGKVLWYQQIAIPNTIDVSQAEIFFYDGTQTIRVTNNQVDDRNAQFYGNSIVWEEQDLSEQGGDYEILLYKNGQTQRLTDNQTEDSLKTVEGNNILWTSFNRLTNQDELFLYDGTKTLQLTSNGFNGNFDTDGQSVVWTKDNSIFLYDGTTTKQITDGSSLKSSVQVSGNQVVWLDSNYLTPEIVFGNISNISPSEVFLYDGNQISQLTDNSQNEYNLQINGENIIWQVNNLADSPYLASSDIYIYRNGAVSPLATTNQNENILALGNNKLVGYINIPQFIQVESEVNINYYPSISYNFGSENVKNIIISEEPRTSTELFLATWTDDTFPILEHPDQYGASNPDLIEAYGYNLDAFNQHYRDFGLAEGRSIDNFDEFEYLASNPDVIGVYGANGTFATRHYIENGYAERRLTDTFQADQYIASNPDLIYVFSSHSFDGCAQEPDLIGATHHYIQNGYSEGRATDTFNEVSYLAANSDLIGTFGFDLNAATKHYLQYGFSEGRSLTFDASEYLASNTDLIDALNGNRTLATEHYIESGYREGRQVYGDFDALQYLASNRDVLNQFGVNRQAATDHFVDYGHQEGRAKNTFDEYRYLASNLDLISVYSSYSYFYPNYNYVDTSGATAHYLYNGIAENRQTMSFDPAAYYAANPDLASYYNNDLTQASYHYVQFGYYEGRSAAPGQPPATIIPSQNPYPGFIIEPVEPGIIFPPDPLLPCT